MKILHVTEAFGGGVQSSMRHFIDSTPGATHVVFARARGGEETSISDHARVIKHEGGTLSFLREAGRVARRERPDVVHLHSSKAGLARLLPLRRIRRIYSPHCYAFQREDVNKVARYAYRAAERALAYRTDVVVAVSPHESDLASSLRSNQRVVVASNLPPLRDFAARPATGHRVITVGRISVQKDPACFAEVARILGAGYELVWVGDGDPALRLELQDAGVDVTGWLDDAGVERELLDSDLYLHTALWEASPMSIAQALAVGLPVLCRDEPSLLSLGYANAGKSVQDVAESVRAFLSDPAYAEKTLRSARLSIDMSREHSAAERLKVAYGKEEFSDGS